VQDVNYITIVLSIFSSAILNGALFFLLKTWITERLRQSIAHEYALQLETHRAELKKEYDVALEKLRVDNAQQAAIQTAAIGSFAESHKAAHERRLQAVEMAWNAIGIIRGNTPLVLYLLDSVAREEYHEFFSKASYPPPFDSPSEETHLNFIKKTMPSAIKVVNARPFVGETIYALFMAYHVLVMVAIYKLIEGNQKKGGQRRGLRKRVRGNC
jgi:hypothetical protein